MIKNFILFLSLITSLTSLADLQVAEIPEGINKKTKCLNNNFLITTPSNSSKSSPLFIFLHGMGKRGNDVNQLKGMAKLICKNTKKHEMITVLPQCTKDNQGKGWWNNNDLNLLLGHLKNTYKIDEKRIYLAGFSMGGFGTWSWAMNRPEVFAAIAPMAGGGNIKDIKKLKDMYIWAFHGKKDTTVKYEKSKVLVDALIKAKSEKVKFTTYADQGHGIVMNTLKNPDLYKWFSEKQK